MSDPNETPDAVITITLTVTRRGLRSGTSVQAAEALGPACLGALTQAASAAGERMATIVGASLLDQAGQLERVCTALVLGTTPELPTHPCTNPRIGRA